MKSLDWIFEPTVKRDGDLILTSRGFVTALAAGARQSQDRETGLGPKDGRAARKGNARLRLVA